MTHLLNLLAAIALLVWGTHLVRIDILRVLGARLRSLLAQSASNRFKAGLAGIGVTALLQSSTATALIVSAFVGQGLMTLAAALAVMLGADIGTSLMAVVLALDLSWLSPLFIFVGVVLSIARGASTAGYVGRLLIGLGLMLLALHLVGVSANELTRAPAMQVVLSSLSGDLLLAITLGTVLSVLSYSSLVIVLLSATLASTHVLTLPMALGLVLGANLGSGLLAVLTTLSSSVQTRQVPLGNLLFKVIGVILVAPLLGLWAQHLPAILGNLTSVVVLFHLGFNLLVGLVFIGFTEAVAAWVHTLFPAASSDAGSRQNHLDPSALATPGVALSCAVREAMRQSDVVETMLRGALVVIQNNDLALAKSLQAMDDTVDEMYSDIKYYLAKISRESLSEKEGQRWADIISFTINMEQIGDLIEHVLIEVENKKIKLARSFSDEGVAEITELHERLVNNLRLGMSVFLDGNLQDAKQLLEEKTRFRDLELKYAANHLDRLSGNSLPSIETSSLHLDLISDLKRINSHICSIAYPILDAAGVLAPSRLRKPAASQTN